MTQVVVLRSFEGFGRQLQVGEVVEIDDPLRTQQLEKFRWVTPVSAASTAEAAVAIARITQLPLKEMKDVLQDTTDFGALRRALAQESRPSGKKLIKARLRALQAEEGGPE